MIANPYDRDGETVLPADILAEYALLGVILMDNSALPIVDSIITAEAFFEPVCGRMFDVLRGLILADRAAEPIIVARHMQDDPGLSQLGGLSFLSDLIENAPATSTAPDYARLIRELWQRRRLVVLGRELAIAALKGGDFTAGGLMESVERDLLGLQTIAKEVVLMSAAEAVAKVVEQFENPNTNAGVLLGISKLDEAMGGGMQPGELWLLAGRPSMGKSAIASCGALNIARHGLSPGGQRLGVIELNMEMDEGAMMRRHISDAAFDLIAMQGPKYSDVRRRNLSDIERTAFYTAAHQIRDLETLKMIKRSLTLSRVRAIVRRQALAWKRQGIKLALVTIDHFGLMGSDEKGFRGRTEAQTEIAIGAKQLAGDLDVPILGLLQLNRNVESRDDKRPQLADLRDSGAWEENADGVIGVYRDAYYAQREAEPKRDVDRMMWDARKISKSVDCIFLKVREGSVGNIPLWGDMARNAIRDEDPALSTHGQTAFFDGETRRTVLDAQARRDALLDPDKPLTAPVDERPSAPLPDAPAYDPSEFE